MTTSHPLPRIAFYGDVACPYAYLTAFRLCKLRDELRGRVEIVPRCLALEYVNREPTPKDVLDQEAPLVLLAEPDIPYQPWHAPASTWPVTLWPAFEAIKCAERQGIEYTLDLDWAIRTAFFADSRCVSLRQVLLDLAAQVGLDLDRFVADFDAGVAKWQVIAETRMGWEQLKVPGSPTLVSPSGRQVSGAALGLPEVELDPARHQRLVRYEPTLCSGAECLDLLRHALGEATAGVARTGEA